MIREINFQLEPMEIGEIRPLSVSGDAPFQVGVSCFVREPRPPGYRPCPHCVVRSISENETMDIEVSEEFWENRQGNLEIKVTDRKGDSRILKLQVNSRESGTQRGAVAGY